MSNWEYNGFEQVLQVLRPEVVQDQTYRENGEWKLGDSHGCTTTEYFSGIPYTYISVSTPWYPDVHVGFPTAVQTSPSLNQWTCYLLLKLGQKNKGVHCWFKWEAGRDTQR